MPVLWRTNRQTDPSYCIWKCSFFETDRQTDTILIYMDLLNDPKNVANSGIQSNWPPWWSKTLHDQQGDPTDLLGESKTFRDEHGDQTDLLGDPKTFHDKHGDPIDVLGDPKTLCDQQGNPTDLIGDPKTLRDQQGNPTDLLDDPKRCMTNRGIQLTFKCSDGVSRPTQVKGWFSKWLQMLAHQ